MHTKETQPCENTIQLIYLSALRFLCSYRSHKSCNSSLKPPQRTSFSPPSSVSFHELLQGSCQGKRPLTPLPSQRCLVGSCPSLREKVFLVPPVQLMSSPGAPPIFSQSLHSWKTAANLITLMFHQVESFGRWRFGIWILIYPLLTPTHKCCSWLQLNRFTFIKCQMK